MASKAKGKKRNCRVERDEWGRPVVYVASYTGSSGGGGNCIFTNLKSAISYVVTGLGSEVDWTTFPDPSGKYPYEERNGQEKYRYAHAFVLKRTASNGKPITAEVWRTAAATDWIVGNAIAEAGKRFYMQATGRDDVVLSGKGDELRGSLGRKGTS